jgi:hypothetical protein
MPPGVSPTTTEALADALAEAAREEPEIIVDCRI